MFKRTMQACETNTLDWIFKYSSKLQPIDDQTTINQQSTLQPSMGPLTRSHNIQAVRPDQPKSPTRQPTQQSTDNQHWLERLTQNKPKTIAGPSVKQGTSKRRSSNNQITISSRTTFANQPTCRPTKSPDRQPAQQSTDNQQSNNIQHQIKIKHRTN